MPDDTFELYDLRVEVVCPEGEKIICGAKNGDYFTLEGEMMYLPAGQGISIYSLCEIPQILDTILLPNLLMVDSRRAAFARCEATDDPRPRLDEYRRLDCLSGPQLQVAAEDYPYGHQEVQPCRHHSSWTGRQLVGK